MKDAFTPMSEWADQSIAAAHRGSQLLIQSNPPVKSWIAIVQQGVRYLSRKLDARHRDQDESK